MSRSIGDFIAASVGVSAEPGIIQCTIKEIIEHMIDETDKFIIIASDGVWEYLSNEVVVNIVAPFYEQSDMNAASDALMKEARY